MTAKTTYPAAASNSVLPANHSTLCTPSQAKQLWQGHARHRETPKT